jgi:hypothetical protein
MPTNRQKAKLCNLKFEFRTALKLTALAIKLFVATAILSLFLIYPAEIGQYSLGTRTALAEVAVLLVMLTVIIAGALLGKALGLKAFRSVQIGIGVLSSMALLSPPYYFFIHLPAQATGGVFARQLASSLITQGTSSGIIEVGFAYPIFTPTLEVTNRGLYTQRFDVYLGIIDADGEATLFRAVRQTLPDSRLTVENAVKGMLSRSPGYLFIPLTVPPNSTLSGKVVFIISDLRDGTSFDDAIGRSYQAQFEIREAESGALLLSFPMTGI